MILGTSEEEITVADKNQTEFVSPELIPIGNNNPKKSSDLKPIVKEKLPAPTKHKKQSVKKQPAKKPVKKKEIIRVTKKKEIVQKTKPKKTISKKTADKKSVKQPSKPSALFGEGKPTYYIQIGAFNREPNPKFLKKIEGAGLHYTVNKNEKTRRVRVGPYGSYAEAKAALSDVNSSIGIMGFVVKQK